MATNVDEKLLHESVVRESTARLVAELSKYQTHFSESDVSAFSREEVVENVKLLRSLAGQTGPVKSVVPLFHPGQKTETVAKPVGADQPVVQVQSGLTELLAMMAQQQVQAHQQMLQFMQQLEQDKKMNEARLELEKQTRDEERKIAAQERRAAFDLVESDRKRNEAARWASERLSQETFRLTLAEAEKQRQIELDMLQQQIKMTEEHHQQEVSRSDRLDRERREYNSRPEIRSKHAHEAVRGLLYNIPQNASDVPAWFQAMDNIFTIQKIDDDLRIQLLTPFLSDRIRKAIFAVPQEQVSTYTRWKEP